MACQSGFCKLSMIFVLIVILQIIFLNNPTGTNAGMRRKLKKLKEILPLLMAMKKKKVIIIPIPIPMKMGGMSTDSWMGSMGASDMMSMSNGWGMSNMASMGMMSGGGGGGWGGGGGMD